MTRNIAVYVLPDYQAERLRRAHPQRLRVNRIGLTVTKKLGGAVVRNRTKRVIREAYRLLAAERKIKTGYLIVLCAREGATTAKSTALVQDLRETFTRLHLLQPS